MPDIYLLNDTSNFIKTSVSSTTVAGLRGELGLESSTINVNKVSAEDDQELKDDDFVATVAKNKTGGLG